MRVFSLLFFLPCPPSPVAADAAKEAAFAPDEAFACARAVSRMVEMTSQEYLQNCRK